MIPLKTQAIQTALSGNWEQAIALNQDILAENSADIDALNRLGFAYASIGNVKEAKDTYHKVLEIDKLNQIALRNIKRLSTNTNRPITNGFVIQLNNLFIEEPGKTKVIDLINVAEQKIIAVLRSGEALTLSVKRMKVFVLDSQKQYIGMLPDDIGKRLIKFIDGGNTYEAYVKTVSMHKVTIFARETFCAKQFKDQLSFMTRNPGDTISYSKSSTKKSANEKTIDDDQAESDDDSGESV
jgi:tetratricopeptide (TPR) repeat protein